MARPILDEVLGYRPDYIEHLLAHAVHAPNGHAYNRTVQLPERWRIVQERMNHLYKLKAGSEANHIHQQF